MTKEKPKGRSMGKIGEQKLESYRPCGMSLTQKAGTPKLTTLLRRAYQCFKLHVGP